MEALQIHERTVVGDANARGASGRLTKPITASTQTNDAIHPVSRPSTSKPFPSSNSSPSNPGLIVSPVSAGSAFEEAETMPLSANKSSKQESANPKSVEAQMFVSVAPSRSKGRLGLAAAAIGLLLAGTAAGAYLFSNQQSQQNFQNVAAQIEASPTPVSTAAASPKATVKPRTSPTVQPTATPDAAPTPVITSVANVSDILNQAKAYEDRELYAEAIAKYREFQNGNPGSAEADLVNSKLLVLNGIRQLLADAQTDMKAKRYLSARERYRNVLRVKPESQIARAGLAEANAKIASSPLLINPEMSPLRRDGNRQQRIPPSLKKRPKPDDPPTPDRPL